MIQVVIVEDDSNDARILKKYLSDSEKELNVVYKTTVYESGLKFLSEYKACADIIFLDIELSDIDGIETARRIRDVDPDVIIVFTTRMAQYATKGYEVDALDYMLKPLKYYIFLMKMKKALRLIERNSKNNVMIVHSGSQHVRLDVGNIAYIEIRVHNLVYHLNNGTTIDSVGTLKNLVNDLKPYGFVLANKSYLINLRAITLLDDNDIIIGEEKIFLSRRKRKDFLTAFADFYGGGVING